MKHTSAVLVGGDIPLEFVEWVQERKTQEIIHGHKDLQCGVEPSPVSLTPAFFFQIGVKRSSEGTSTSSQDGVKPSFASPAIIVKGSVVLKDQALQED